jgi:hypothetical protein
MCPHSTHCLVLFNSMISIDNFKLEPKNIFLTLSLNSEVKSNGMPLILNEVLNLQYVHSSKIY